jgi:hypothetical protein
MEEPYPNSRVYEWGLPCYLVFDMVFHLKHSSGYFSNNSNEQLFKE